MQHEEGAAERSVVQCSTYDISGGVGSRERLDIGGVLEPHVCGIKTEGKRDSKKIMPGRRFFGWAV